PHPPPPHPPRSTPFPYTTLFRSRCQSSGTLTVANPTELGPRPRGRPSARDSPHFPPARHDAVRPARSVGCPGAAMPGRSQPADRSEEHTSELQSRENLVCRLLLE